MAALCGRLLRCGGCFPPHQIVRHRSKAVTRHRKPLHILRQKLLAVTEYIPPKPAIPERCIRAPKQEEKEPSGFEKLLRREMEVTFSENKMITVFQNNSINSEDLKLLRHRLLKHDIRMKFFPNQVLRSYLENTKYRNLLPLFIGHNIIIVSKEPKAKELLQTVRNTTQISLLGACIEDVLFSRQGVVNYSKLPGMQIARGEIVSGLTLMTSQTCQLLQSGPARLTALLEQYVKEQTEAATGLKETGNLEQKEIQGSPGS